MYKIKKYLPLEARLQIYHSFVQSHLNFCSLVWGFTCKSNIEKIFAKQKKGIRAVIPGFVNYFYAEGEIPGHTKAAFREYKILTIHNIIVLNALLFIFKVNHSPATLPPSVRNMISEHGPVAGSTHESCADWLDNFNNHIYRKSVFFKGPLLWACSKINNEIPPTNLLSVDSYKINAKRILGEKQIVGNPDEWSNENFALYSCAGLRINMSRGALVRYNEYF